MNVEVIGQLTFWMLQVKTFFRHIFLSILSPGKMHVNMQRVRAINRAGLVIYANKFISEVRTFHRLPAVFVSACMCVLWFIFVSRNFQVDFGLP